MNAPLPAGYAGFGPQQVLDALATAGLHGDGRILQLNSYENRVWQLFLEDGQAVVAKFYRPGRWSDAQILEEHAFSLDLAAEEVAVVPPLVLSPAADTVRWLPAAAPTLGVLEGETPHRFTVARRCAGREPELEQPGVLRRIGAFIGRLHAVGARQGFSHRMTMSPGEDAAAARHQLLALELVTDGERPAWADASARAADAIAEAFRRAGPVQTLRLHGDCHPGNVLWRDGPHVVDLDDACNGPAVQDLWMLVSGDATTMRRQFDELLAGYEDFREFDDAERPLIEPLRTLRMLRHAAWLSARWHDPSFPLNFPFFGTPAYWSQQTAQLREQCTLMGG
ncbi:MAG: serine/threonine protein kinase [Burkholderiaceae bacterium]|nr:serine/threonine protein kinase [Burkholderiaceae bacterium]